MKRQSGFTLIELLLVLAIIGIISAIAIPALLSQRARARDKSCTSNAVSKVGDLMGQWDKQRELGKTATSALSLMETYLGNTTAQEKNPWNTSGASAAFLTTIPSISGHTTASGFETSLQTLATSTNIGQVQIGCQLPSATGGPGFIGAAVKTNGVGVKSKVSSLE